MAQSNSIDSLNLYAKIEDLLGIKEYSPKLYNYYFNILDKIKFNSLLDIGCGGGEFLLEVKNRYKIDDLLGVDKSSYMVKSAKKLGLNVVLGEISDINKEFDVATATFDMINYLTPQEFIDFFEKMKSIVKENGFFIFDVNSEYGFEEVAVGNFVAEDEDRFLTIESFYEGGEYESIFTLFEKINSCYSKSKDTIKQYYYSETFFELLGGWKLVEKLPINLYGFEKYDKEIYILKHIKN